MAKRCNMTKLHDTSCSYEEPLWGASVKVHLFRCSRDVEILRVQQMAVNFTALCQIVAYILKVVFSMTISRSKYDF